MNAIRVSLEDADNFNITPISGLDGGSITNPPLYCPRRKILVAYDSANSVICGFSGPAGAKLLKDKGVKIVLFTPV